MSYFNSTLWHVRSFTYLLYVKVLHISYISKFYIFLTFQSFTYFLHFKVLHISCISKFYIFLAFQSFTYFLHSKVLHISYISKFYIFLSYSRCTVCCVNISFVFKFLACTTCSTFCTCQRYIFTCLTVLQYFYHVNCLLFIQFYSICITSTVFHCLRQFIHLIQ